MFAVAISTSCETATKSPKEQRGSAFRALTYAVGVSSLPTTSYTSFSASLSGTPMAAPAGLTCLKDAAAGRSVAIASSCTNCHALIASRRLIYPGVPLTTEKGNSVEPLSKQRPAGFWCGLQPYFNGRSTRNATEVTCGGASTCDAMYWLIAASYAAVVANAAAAKFFRNDILVLPLL